MTTSLPDYEAKKAAAELYGWELCGWDGEPKKESSVLLSRWEDKFGHPCPPPPLITRADGRMFYDCLDGEHQAFARMPHYDSPEIWLLLLRVEELRKHRASQVDL